MTLASRWVAAALLALALGATGPARAQEGGVPQTPSATPSIGAPGLGAGMMGAAMPQSGAVEPDAYRLGPGDVIAIYIWGPISRYIPLEVGPEGQVFVPGAGSVHVAGLTLAAGRARLEALVRSQYRGVRIEVRLQRVRTIEVYLTGEVSKLGPLYAQGASRVADVMQDTMFASGASRRNIELRHRDGTHVVVDLERFYRTGEESDDTFLRDGDVIHVPHQIGNVGVWGGVANPEEYDLGPRDSLRTLIALAGGLLPSAVRDRALLLRWTSATGRDSMWTSLDAVESGTFNPPLQNGDQFFVFMTPGYLEPHNVEVLGEVQRAGNYPIAVGRTRLTDAIRAAGGFRPDADLSAIQLVRKSLGDGRKDPEYERLSRLPRTAMTESEYESFRTRTAALSPEFRIDWRRVEHGDPALDPLLLAGDVIRVERVSNSVRVDGQVRNPGVYEFHPGLAAEDYVRLAGGFTSHAAKSRVRVTRAINGQTQIARTAHDLTPGDFVWVPERPDASVWTQLKGLITVAAQLAAIVIAVRR